MEAEGGVINWIRVALTVYAGGSVASLTDRLYMGDWLYKRHYLYREICFTLTVASELSRIRVCRDEITCPIQAIIPIFHTEHR